jgi:hypothetical protein
MTDEIRRLAVGGEGLAGPVSRQRAVGGGAVLRLGVLRESGGGQQRS